MQLIDVIPKDIHFILDISFVDMKKLKFALDNSEFKLNLSNNYEREVNNYVNEVFYKTVEEAIKGVEGDKS